MSVLSHRALPLLSLPLLCLLPSSSAHALDPDAVYDLDLDLQLLDAEPIQLSLHDVRPGPQPGLWVDGAAGQRYRVSIELVEVDKAETEAVRFEVLVEEDLEVRRGRWESRRLAAPRITAPVGEEARVMVGTNIPLGADPAEHPPRLQLSLLLSEAP